jgi:hypothetical protein
MNLKDHRKEAGFFIIFESDDLVLSDTFKRGTFKVKNKF